MADFREQRDILKAVNEELGKSSNLIRQATSEVTKLESITKNLQFNAEGVARMSDKQLKNAESQAKVALEELKRKSQLLAKEKGIVDLSKTNLGFRRDLSQNEKALLQAAKEGFKVEEETVRLAKDEVRIRKGVNKSMGLTGILAKGLSKTLGIDLSDSLEGARNKAEEVNRKFVESDETAGDVVDKLGGDLQVSLQSIGGLATGLADAFMSTDAIVGALVASFTKFGNLQRENRQLTGQTADNFTIMNDSILSTADMVGTITSLSSQLGVNVNATFSKETIKEASEFTNLMGISEETTAQLAQQAEAFGFELAEVKDAAFDQVQAFAKSGKAALNVQQILEDTTKVSGRLTVSLGKNPKELAKAAAEARALGLSLEEMEGVADGLLDFESSIAAEMEAELLTGQQLNLEQARQFALMNDMEGLTQEIGKNQALMNSYTTGNRIEQQAIEKALGLSSTQIAEIIQKQSMSAEMTAAEAEKAAQVKEEEMERLALQDEIAKSFEKLAMAAQPFVDMMASLLQNTGLVKGLIVGIAAIKLGGLIAGFVGLIAKLKVAIPLLISKLSVQTGGFGVPIALAAAAAGLAGFSALTMKDGVIDSQGGMVVSGPKGSISLDREDTIVANKNGVIAGTNLGGGGGNNAAMMERMDRLIAATERGSTITMDGNLVGRSVADNTSALG